MPYDKITRLKEKLRKLRCKPDKGSSGRAKVDVLDELAYAFFSSDPKKTENYARQALALAEKLNYKKGIVETHRTIGISYVVRSNYQRGIMYYLRSLQLAKKIRYKHGIAACYGNIGNVHQEQGNYQQALEYYLKSLRIEEDLKNELDIATSQHNIGILYYKQGNYRQALEYHQKALIVFEKSRDKRDIARSYNNIGEIYFHKNSLNQASQYYFKSLRLNQEIRDKNGIAESYQHIGHVYRRQDEYTKALKYYTKSLTVFKKIEDRRNVARSYRNIGHVHTRLKHYGLALSYVLNGLQIAQKIGEKNLELSSYKSLSELYEVMNSHKESLSYYKRYTDLEREMFNAEKSKQITEMRIKYETEKKEKEAEIHRLKNVELKQEIRERKKAEKELNKHRKHLEIMVQERTAQLRSLTHELSLVEEMQRRKIATYLHDEISQKLALVAFKLESLQEHASRREVKAEVDAVMKILDQTTQRIRSLTFEISPPILYELGFEPAVEWLLENFGKQYDIKCKLMDDGEHKPLSNDTRVLLFQSVRELLVNIAKHAQAQNVKAIMTTKNHAIQITVKDDGKGFDTGIIDGKIKENKGFGLFSIKERLDYLNGSMKITSKIDKGTTVTMSAPLQRTKKKDARRKR